jgi:hypothetical protein
MGGSMMNEQNEIEAVEPKTLTNFRRNRLGGIDADRELGGGEVVPYTLEKSEYSQAVDVAEYDGVAIEKAAKLERAKAYRDRAIDADLTALEASWQVDPISRSRMRETISVAAATNQPAETTIPWRLSDNAWRPTTSADLTAVLVAYAYRMAHIFQAFSAWEDKDDGSEFEL